MHGTETLIMKISLQNAPIARTRIYLTELLTLKPLTVRPLNTSLTRKSNVLSANRSLISKEIV
jgi:hypothetical protein